MLVFLSTQAKISRGEEPTKPVSLFMFVGEKDKNFCCSIYSAFLPLLKMKSCNFMAMGRSHPLPASRVSAVFDWSVTLAGGMRLGLYLNLTGENC